MKRREFIAALGGAAALAAVAGAEQAPKYPAWCTALQHAAS